jgi:hypothetical protein
MSAVTDAARHLRPRDRGRFLEAIAERLRDRVEIGGGELTAPWRSASTAFEPERQAWLSP